MNNRLRVVPYTWDPTTNPVKGVAILRGQFVKAFIPMDRALEVADRLVDIYEQDEGRGTD